MLLWALVLLAGNALALTVVNIESPAVKARVDEYSGLLGLLFIGQLIGALILLTDFRGRAYGPSPAWVRRQWWANNGLWYLVVPVVSVGLYSWIPFFHVGRRLGDRKAIWLGWLFLAGGILAGALMFWPSLTGDASGDSASYIRRVLLPGVLTLWLVVGAIALLAGLRRRIYFNIPRDVASDSPAVEKLIATNPIERRIRTVTNVAAALAGCAVFGVAIPVGAVRKTLAGDGGPFLGGGTFIENLSLVVLAVVALLALVGWLVIDYRNEEDAAIHGIFLAVATVVNIYLAFAVWIVGTTVVDDVAQSNPRQFGEMVWWNLTDSIPLLDVDATLDWERPLENYGAILGWMFVFQRIVLLLTLARTLQLLIQAWLTPQKD